MQQLCPVNRKSIRHNEHELKSFLLISLIFDKGNKIMKPRRRDILSPGEQRFKDTVWFIFWSKEVIGPS